LFEFEDYRSHVEHIVGLIYGRGCYQQEMYV